MKHEDVEHWQILEDRKFRLSLVQQRLQAGLTVSDVAEAMRIGEDTVETEIEDERHDLSMSTIRRYAKAVGAIYRHGVVAVPPESDEEQDAQGHSNGPPPGCTD